MKKLQAVILLELGISKQNYPVAVIATRDFQGFHYKLDFRSGWCHEFDAVLTEHRSANPQQLVR